MNNKVVFIIGILGVVFFWGTALLGGLFMADYNPISQYISETYATGTPYGKALSYFGYLPAGVFLTVFSLAAPAKFPKSTVIKIGFWGLALFYGVATLVVAIFPCDTGCNKEFINPSISQIIHNFIAALTYLFVPFSILLIGVGLKQLKKYSRLTTIAFVCALIAILFVGLLAKNPLTSYAGLYQRIIESAFGIWILFCAFEINGQRNE